MWRKEGGTAAPPNARGAQLQPQTPQRSGVRKGAPSTSFLQAITRSDKRRYRTRYAVIAAAQRVAAACRRAALKMFILMLR